MNPPQTPDEHRRLGLQFNFVLIEKKNLFLLQGRVKGLYHKILNSFPESPHPGPQMTGTRDCTTRSETFSVN
jgi:hypothetical protein